MNFSILGPLEIAGAHGPVAVRGPRPTSLISTLLLRCGQPASLVMLVDALWPHEPPRSAIDNIRTHISGLRRMLTKAGDAAGRLTSDNGSYRLDVSAEEFDLLRFNALAETANRAMHAGDYTSVVAAADSAMILWRGQPLLGVELGSEMLAVTAALDERHSTTFSSWIGARLALGEHETLIPLLRAKVTERGLNEKTWAHLAIALHTSGRTGDALAACAEARRTFIDELGIEPAGDIVEVQDAILHGTDLLRLSALSQTSERMAVIPQQLPPATADIVGHRRARRRLQRVAEQITQDDDRAAAGVVTVSGQPGVGKSAVAIAAARGFATRFPGGQLFLPLHGSRGAPLGPAEALGQLLTGLGWDPVDIPDGLQSRLALYRSVLADREVLIVLDDAADASQVRPLLPTNQRSLAVVTSRSTLPELEALERLILEPLDQDAAVDLLASHVGPERLAVEPDAVRVIVDACGGLPLALRVIGARMAARPGRPMAMFADRLADEDQRLDELSIGEGALRSRFESSYHSLTPPGQIAFVGLAALDPQRITIEAACAALDLPESATELLLEQLLEQGLLQSWESGYRMPGLLHLFARERATDNGR